MNSVISYFGLLLTTILIISGCADSAEDVVSPDAPPSVETNWTLDRELIISAQSSFENKEYGIKIFHNDRATFYQYGVYSQNRAVPGQLSINGSVLNSSAIFHDGSVQFDVNSYEDRQVLVNNLMQQEANIALQLETDERTFDPVYFNTTGFKSKYDSLLNMDWGYFPNYGGILTLYSVNSTIEMQIHFNYILFAVVNTGTNQISMDGQIVFTEQSHNTDTYFGHVVVFSTHTAYDTILNALRTQDVVNFQINSEPIFEVGTFGFNLQYDRLEI